MRSRLIALVAVVAVAACSTKSNTSADTGMAAQGVVTPPADRSADAAAIVKADSAWLRHVMGKHVDSIMPYYLPEAVSYGFGTAPASGTEQLRALYTEIVKSTITNPALISNTVKFSDDGTMAFDHGTYTMTVTPPGGKTETVNGAYLNVWRNVDGQWKMLAEMSTPIPAPKK
jgi:ketosteroid isomerase-like protein